MRKTFKANDILVDFAEYSIEPCEMKMHKIITRSILFLEQAMGMPRGAKQMVISKEQAAISFLRFVENSPCYN